MNDILIAVISALAVAIPSVWTTYSNNKRHSELLNYRIDELTKKVEKHNQVVERMALAERDIKALWHNVDEIKGIKKGEHKDE